MRGDLTNGFTTVGVYVGSFDKPVYRATIAARYPYYILGGVLYKLVAQS
ncbi:MAG: hypothetical protein ACREJQ_04085 [bacterium]